MYVIIALILLILALFLFTEYALDFLKADKETVFKTAIILAFLAFIVVILASTKQSDNRETLNKYINYAEQYKKLENPLGIRDKIYNEKNPFITNNLDEWNKKIEKLKELNEFIFFSVIPDDELNEALELKKQISE